VIRPCTINTGGDTVPWRIVENAGNCPDSKPFAVVKQTTGEVEGCHATRVDATAQLRALYASEPSTSVETKQRLATLASRVLVAAGTPAVAPAPAEDVITANDIIGDAPTVGWEGPMIVEGIETGDQRLFSEGSLSWPELPMALTYQRVTSHGGTTDETVNVGRIDEIWRDGNVIMGRGVIDLADVNGIEAARKIREKYLRGVSIEADSIRDSDVEYVFPEVPVDATEEEQLEAMFANPDLTIINRGRIRTTTLVNTPAFVEAYISLIDDQPLVAAMVTLEQSTHEDERGWRGARGVLVATGGHTIEIPDVPDASWFDEPTELPPIGAVWVTDEGRIFGVVGPSGVAHRAFKHKRVEIPMGNVDYSAWMNRPTIVRGGDRVATGVITMNCGHMSPFGTTDTAVRMEHYENSCAVAAVVRVGESRKLKAPWVAGVLMPMSPLELQRFMACQLSGDWAPHRSKPGWREFVAALTVPVPGFARATNTTRVRVENGAIVASYVPIRHVSELETVDHRQQLEVIKNRITPVIDPRQRLATIRERVNSA
jgi:hypothetical protein